MDRSNKITSIDSQNRPSRLYGVCQHLMIRDPLTSIASLSDRKNIMT